jgi:hypothetical protein
MLESDHQASTERPFRLKASACTEQKRWQYGQICGGISLKLRFSKTDSEDHLTDWYHGAISLDISAERLPRGKSRNNT